MGQGGRAAVLAAALAIAACSRDEQRGPRAAPGAWFVDATETLGLGMLEPYQEPSDYFMPASFGSGAALFDADADGDVDLYVVRAHRDAVGGFESERGANKLLLQVAPGRFEDRTAGSGAAHRGYGAGVAVGDANGDGQLDLYVTNFGPDCLLLGRGAGTFEDSTQGAGLGSEAWGTSAGFVDYDLDGDLDLFVVNYVHYAPSASSTGSAERDYEGPLKFPPAQDRLYENLGEGAFRDVTTQVGMAGSAERGLGCVFADLNADGRVDIFVANDQSRNQAWIQEEAGRFTDRAFELGLAVNAVGTPESSMGIALGDVDGDGSLDLLCSHLRGETHTLYTGARMPGGDRVFRDSTASSGLAMPSLMATGFGAVFLDGDLDGDLDLVVANGDVSRQPARSTAGASGHWGPYTQSDQVFRNDGRGRFELDEAAGVALNTLEVSRGLTWGDLDSDGDLDLVKTTTDGQIRAYLNVAERKGHWLEVRVKDELGREVQGVCVEITAGGVTQRRYISRTRSYQSSVDALAHFGLTQGSVDSVSIVWPGGERETYAGVRVDGLVTLTRGQGSTPRNH